MTETGAQEQHFRVPYGVPAIALQKGAIKYHLAAGVYRPADHSIERVPLWQTSVMYGLPRSITVMGGGQISRHYQSAAGGIGVMAGHLGAVSLDTVRFRGEASSGDQLQGTMWRLRYNKTLAPTGTGTYMSLKHFSSGRNSSLSEILDTWRSVGGQMNKVHTQSRNEHFPENQVELSLSQPVGTLGYLSISGERMFWQHGGASGSLNVSWAVYLPGDISLSLNLNRTTSLSSGTDKMVNLMVSLPLDRWITPGSGASWQMTSSFGEISQEARVYGSGFDRRLHWDIRQSVPVGPAWGEYAQQSAHMDWAGAYGNLGGNYSRSRVMEQMEGNLSGNMVLHHHGLTVGQSMGDTVALIEAPGAEDVSVGQWPSIRTDFRGYTLLGQLTPYQQNIVSLDPASLPPSVDVQQTDYRVVPTMGAVIPIHFVTHPGKKALITLELPDNRTVPFGALVRLLQESPDSGITTGIVADDGMVYLSGLPAEGRLSVQWGHDSAQQCQTDYTLLDGKKPKGSEEIVTVTLTCHPVLASAVPPQVEMDKTGGRTRYKKRDGRLN
ncbi:fimbrial biogenesis outer membrane usher protein [Salmonella enterica subsp. enterica]|nr:fimbrial biogenesis outer membrane usher protein [Salmonella enterica]ECC3607832.1 fimbrial biogenesis outer membrane usher protein [Salmonella enterica subsp. enterica]ECY4645528.1 fimbrial biogenesis outer membrane usher protein [Salmonella enterica subsp. enterica serovar Eastbourne]EBO9664777.1 fimbrial biogenesis outer membrane usher protein [Salmonella enterica]ECE0941356.1 fimbrial biogenesis outer membrane usher protein [Salmonella enterica subsp. enterica]